MSTPPSHALSHLKFMTMTDWDQWFTRWQSAFEQFAADAMSEADAGHDLYHVKRVVANSVRLGGVEGACPSIVMPAAWLHDCVVVRKDSPERNRASRMAAQRAGEFLGSIDYPVQFREYVAHAIIAHSFTAAVCPTTVDAKVVQDADRLEALGALGLARCLMTGGALGQRLFDPIEPFPFRRPADERQQSVDHFYTKLLKLPATMQTQSGRVEAQRRTQVLIRFLEDLAEELGTAASELQQSLSFLTTNCPQAHA